MLLTVDELEPRPLGWPAGLSGFGIPYRWVCIESPANSGKSDAVDQVQAALVEHLASTCEHLGAGSIGRESAEAMVAGVHRVRQPGAELELDDGQVVNLRELARSDLPPAAAFGLFMADRVLQNRKVVEMLDSCSLVIQERGAFSTYVYQCVLGGISSSIFAATTAALTPELPDLMILLSPPAGDGGDAEAYRNPPAHILRLCAKNFALVSTDGLSSEQIAAAIVEAMSGQRLVLPLDR